jgi:hypothetical protein
MQASQILEGKNSGEPVNVTIPCSRGASLNFEYKLDVNNQMSAFLTIDKDNKKILFRFPTTEYDEKIDGQNVTSVMQTGLGIFAMILGCYIAGIAANESIIKNNELYNEAILWAQEQDHKGWEQEIAAQYDN